MSAVITPNVNHEEVLSEWLEAVNALTEQMAEWAAEGGWAVEWRTMRRTEPLLGAYEVPQLTIRSGRRELIIEPVGREIMGATGRVDISAYPSLFRVMLLRSSRDGAWRIRTDSGLFLDKPWARDTFLSLAQDLSDAG